MSFFGASLFQSLFPAHREAGTEILPGEGRLPPFEGATGWLNSPRRVVLTLGASKIGPKFEVRKPKWNTCTLRTRVCLMDRRVCVSFCS
jgi:hypothetical protein